MRKGTTTTVARARRLEDFRAILESRRAELSQDVEVRIRDVRSEGIGDRDVRDAAESSEIDIQDDIGFALIQLKAETLKKINTALRRIDEGDYGDCFECGGEIAEARLRALPFAVRCRDCEAIHETTDRRERLMASRGSSALFVDLSS
jgi:DnaK suppressor protein